MRSDDPELKALREYAVAIGKAAQVFREMALADGKPRGALPPERIRQLAVRLQQYLEEAAAASERYAP